MLLVDKAILDTNEVICKNIAKFDESERGLLSQNILSQLRNLVEYIAQKIYSNGLDTDPNNYQDKKAAWNYILSRGEFRFLSKFHNLLQKSVSHYTFDENGSERLMLKYYEYLIRIKQYLEGVYGLIILENIEEFPLRTDTNMMEYYAQISSRIISPSPNARKNPYNDRAYIQKIKPFFVKNQIYYEVTFTIANDKASKFDRIIAFTRLELTDYYAVKLSIHDDVIQVFGREMPIQIIDGWEVSIRECEINHFADVFGKHAQIKINNIESRALMKYLTDTKTSLVDLVSLNDFDYDLVKKHCAIGARVTIIFNLLDKSRNIIRSNAPGSNIIRYLLYKMNNRVLKKQRDDKQCPKLSDLYLQWGCIPFDNMPYASSLVEHNPHIYDLFECIPSEGRDCEFLSRKIKNNTEQEDMLFTSVDDLKQFDSIDDLIKLFNSKLYYTHANRKIYRFQDYVYIKGYEDDTTDIIRRLVQLSVSGIPNYTSFVDSWLYRNPSYRIDSKEKLEALRTVFTNSRVAMIYGSAGTGKSTLINHISNLYNDRNKLYLANTNPAVENLRRKVNAGNCVFKTIAKYLFQTNAKTDYDILFVDECSTVSNKDMKAVLEKTKFKLLVLVGDVFQIESVLFGNWFSIAKSFIPDTSITELKKPYRSSKDLLIAIWDRVRSLDEAILEPMVKAGCSVRLDESIFDHSERDEIILCLNYDGLYGINNLNRFLQNSNPNTAVKWGVNTYKIGDPILFNESERFSPLIYNNMKGRIVNVLVLDDRIKFEIELDLVITEWEAEPFSFKLVGISENGNSIISFWVNKFKNTDDDDEGSDSIVPFQVAYAVSIHKAQGLEYESVKIVITNEVEELITHNIFYTAITRTKDKLKIYWSPETEKKVLDSLSLKDHHKDAFILKAIENL